jgi:hypothetical protein
LTAPDIDPRQQAIARWTNCSSLLAKYSIALCRISQKGHVHSVSEAIKPGLPGKLLEFQLVHADRWYDLSAYPSAMIWTVGLFRCHTGDTRSQCRIELLRTAVSLNDIVGLRGKSCGGQKSWHRFEAFERRTGCHAGRGDWKTPRILQGLKTQRSELDRIQQRFKAWQPVRAELINHQAGERNFA